MKNELFTPGDARWSVYFVVDAVNGAHSFYG